MINRTVKQLEAELASMMEAMADELALADLIGNTDEVTEKWEAAIASQRALIKARKAQDEAPCELPRGVRIPLAYSGAKSEFEGSDMWA